MKRASLFILITSLLLLLLSSCAAPKKAQPNVAPVAPPTEPVAQKPTKAQIEQAFVEIEEAKVEKQKKDIEHVQNVVNMRQSELQFLYQREAAIKPFQGDAQIKISINEMGMIQNSEVLVTSGSLSQEFIKALQSDLSSWRFLVRTPMIFTFSIKFTESL
jgi:hypothetical protein